MSQIVECGHNLKSFDLEKLQSLTLSGEKITKEIFDALFINQSPYCFSNQSVVYPLNYNSSREFQNPGLATYHHRNEDTFNSKNYEIFRGAYENAANCSKIAQSELSENGFQYFESRFCQEQNYFQGF